MAPMLTDVPEIPYLPRFDLYAMLGLVRVMEPHTELLMRELAEAERVADDYDSPHERPWFVSFHGSEFPGEPQDACKRYLTYRMMNIPKAEITPPWVTTCGTVGKAGELDIARAWYAGGRLLAIPEDPSQPARYQLGFVDPKVWFTCSTDLPILPPGWRRPHIVEIKGKADEVVEEMLQGRLVQRMDKTIERVGRGPDSAHTNQLKATIGSAYDFDWGEVTVCSSCWRILFADIFEQLGHNQRMNPAISEERAAEDNLRNCPWCNEEAEWETFHLNPPTTGEIYYWSRSWPRKTKSFYYDYDPVFMERGKQILAETREHYINDELPPRPGHFQWGLSPCKTCNFYSACRLDSGLLPRKRKPDPEIMRTTLTGSHAVEYAMEIRPGYDPEAVRRRVFEEWNHDG